MTNTNSPGAPAPKWPINYEHAAWLEGWNLFQVDGVIKIQRVDDPPAWDYWNYWRDNAKPEPKFKSDKSAIAYVKRHKNTPHGRRALLLHGSKT